MRPCLPELTGRTEVTCRRIQDRSCCASDHLASAVDSTREALIPAECSEINDLAALPKHSTSLWDIANWPLLGVKTYQWIDVTVFRRSSDYPVRAYPAL